LLLRPTIPIGPGSLIGVPQFFANVGRGWRYGILSIIEIVTVMALVLLAAAVLKLDRGTAGGCLRVRPRNWP
jgi:hypothetical protein